MILKQLQDPLAEELLRGGYKAHDTVRKEILRVALGELSMAAERAGGEADRPKFIQ